MDKEKLKLIGGEALQRFNEGPLDGIGGVLAKTIDDRYVSDWRYLKCAEHVQALWIAYCRLMADSDLQYGCANSVWRSKIRYNGEVLKGEFVLGMNYKAGEQITYYLPIEHWESCDSFAVTLVRAPKWDGHTPDDVLSRL